MKSLDVLVVTSSNYKELYEDFFLSSLNPTFHGFQMHVGYIDLTMFSDFGFQRPSWYKAITEKAKHIFTVMKRLPLDTYLVFSDADIQYFRPAEVCDLVQEARDNSLDYYGMRENWENLFNTGFFIIKNKEATQTLWETIYKRLLSGETPDQGDQSILNELLIHNRNGKIRHAFIPNHMYVWGTIIHASAKMPIFHHAVCCTTIEDKKKQMVQVRDLICAKFINQPSDR
jgi:hypothetical protein